MADHTAEVGVALRDDTRTPPGVTNDNVMLNRVVEPESPEAAEMRRQVEAAIARDKADPRQQSYMFNKTTGRLIRTNAMYHRAQENQDQIEIVSYAQAEQIFKREQAEKRAAWAKVNKRKRAKQARKKSRGS